MYTTKHNARAKYILKKIDLALKEYSEKPDYRSLTLEHIFPQNPNKDWDDKLKEKGSKIVKNPSEYLNRIGNLTLLDIKMNKGASNLYFTEKKNTHYSRSTLNLNLDLNNFDSWDEVEISSRQESLASIAKEIWKIK